MRPRSLLSALQIHLLILVLTFCVSVSPSKASWHPDGNRVTNPPGIQTDIVTVSDGAGGMIAAWTEQRPASSSWDIYAQRLDATGTPLWGSTGLVVCGALGIQLGPAIVTDGVGGAIVYWDDRRAGGSDIYAQRLSGAGAALWAADGVGIEIAPLNQREPRAVSTGPGESIVVWHTSGPGVSALSAQKVDGAGATLWPGGVGVAGPALVVNPDLIHDGAGGVAIAYELLGLGWDIFAQHVDAAGVPLWPLGGAPICAVALNQHNPRISRMGASYAIVWEDNRGADSDIYSQRVIPATGAPIWAVNGIPVCVAPGDQQHPVVSDVLAPLPLYAWADARGADWDIYGQVLALNGVPSWAVNGAGLVISPGSQSDFSMVASTGAEPGALFDLVWCDVGAAPDYDLIRGQRFSSAPAALWVPGGVALCTQEGDQNQPVAAASAPSLLVAWGDRRGSFTAGFCQSVSAGGALAWASSGNAMSLYDPDVGPHVAALSIGEGVVDAWVDRRTGEGDIYAQRVHVDGQMLWTEKGAVCLAVGEQRDPAIAADGSGGAFLAWLDDRAGGPPEIFAQHLTVDGAPSWAVDGVAVCSAAGDRTDVRVVADGIGGMIIAWSDARGPDSDIYVQHLSDLGVPILALDGIPLCAAGGDQVSPRMVPLSPAQAVVVWEDHRAGGADIYAHRFNNAGVPHPGWPVNGAPVCVNPAEQVKPQIDENLVIVWRDARGPSLDIYADRITTATGASMWAANGLGVCVAAGDQTNPQVARATVAGVATLVAWEDSRFADVDIYAQRLNEAGLAKWLPDGKLVCGAADDQDRLSLAADASGGALLTWSDGRGATRDIYAQQLLSLDGAGNWGTNGLLLCDRAGDQVEPIVIGDAVGGGTVSWVDPRFAATSVIYAARVAPQGGLFLTSVEDATTAGRVRLRQNAPNPFNPSTRIEFVIPEAGSVRLDVYDVRGRFVARLLDEDRPAGPHEIRWQGVDRSGAPVASGVYYYQLEALGVRDHRKMVLLK